MLAANVDPTPSTATSKPTPSHAFTAFLLRGALPCGAFRLSIDIFYPLTLVGL
jgi:hypothetical protein